MGHMRTGVCMGHVGKGGCMGHMGKGVYLAGVVMVAPIHSFMPTRIAQATRPTYFHQYSPSG